MSDAPEIFHTKEEYAGMSSEARCILILMGFKGVWDFAKRSGINHDTAGQILGTVKPKNKHNYDVIIRTNETLHTAFMEQREQMSKPKRAYIVDWVQRWQKWAVEEILRLESPGKVKSSQDTCGGRRYIKRRAAVKAGVVQALSVLKWE